MVKERSYKILEQLDEYELQENGDSSIPVYDSDSDDQHLARDMQANVVPSAMDADDEDISDDEHDREPAASNSAGSAASAQQGSSATTVVPASTDGVFSNMAAKPDVYLGYDDKVPDEPLPTYQDIYGPQSNGAPPYFEPAVISVGDEEELLIEGLPVGSLGVFVVNLVVSTAFQIVGYMLTFLLHTSHAAKNGSLAGLGITFFNFGFYIRTHLGENILGDMPSMPPQGGQGQNGEDGQYDMDSPLDNA
ncbi:hypothetical protein FBU59_006862, partial [Linderina macrospora]